ncbi:MAG: glycine--tRNA ligase [Phycisphaerales bacterium]|nr:glycine--tRNA ligase [Phycisphaerales bacterium]
MDEIMALCKRRGFVFQASEIYGGINGFWDYGPLGAQLKKNLRDAWWQDVVMNPCWGRTGPSGERVRTVPLDSTIIQHPRVWQASGHIAGFNDPMVDCRETKQRYRYDHVQVFTRQGTTSEAPMFAFVLGTETENRQRKKAEKKFDMKMEVVALSDIAPADWPKVLAPHAEAIGTLTEPKQFNLMFKTYVGATAGEDDVAYLRPETAQGIFVQFKNVVDTTRVKIPFGIAQTGKAFRNEVTPRNFTFRSREFEQMEVEFFCHESEALDWFSFWRKWRMEWWESIGLAGENLRLYDTPQKDLAHYAKAGSDVEYRFPFTAPGFGELEGIAYRGDFDLRQHAEHSGLKDNLKYFDMTRGEPLPNGQPKGEKYFPHVIEPSAGLDRGVLAILCEAYTKDASRPSPEIMRFHPRVAPIKAAVFPLVNKDGMPEVADRLHAELQGRFGRSGFIETDAKQSIGKRYARMDEAGCPYCFTVDGDTLTGQTVTVRDRDTGKQDRIALDKVGGFLAGKLGA